MLAKKPVFDALPNTPAQCSEFRAALAAPPPTPDWIEMRVRVTASLYYVPNERPEVLAMAMQQWRKIIGEIPGPLAAWAFDEWERTQTHRPSPAHIRQIASRRRNELARAIPRPEPEPEPHETEEGRARIAAAFAALKAEAGFSGALKAMDAYPEDGA